MRRAAPGPSMAGINDTGSGRMKTRHGLTVAIGAALLGAVSTVTAAAPTAGQAPVSGPTLEARLRGEWVDDRALARDASASTLRVRLGYRTPVRSGWSAVAEI